MKLISKTLLFGELYSVGMQTFGMLIFQRDWQGNNIFKLLKELVNE